MYPRRTTWAAIAALPLFACGMDFEQQSQIARVRVLGVRSQPAELTLPTTSEALGPPTSVKMEALAVAPEERPVTVQFALCRPFANVYAADFECPGKDGVDLVDGEVSLLNPTLAALFAGSGGGALEDPALISQLDAGLPLQVGYLATDGTPGERGLERGYATLWVRRTDAPNQNPELVDVLLEDAQTLEGRTLGRGQTVELAPSFSPDAQELFTENGAQVQEALSLSWFASGEASIGNLRSAVFSGGDAIQSTTTLTVPDSAGSASVWVVARDGRGGTSWLRRVFSYE